MRTLFFQKASARKTWARKTATFAVALVAPFVLAACGDDANDAGVATRQLQSRLAAAQEAGDELTSDEPASSAPTPDVTATD